MLSFTPISSRKIRVMLVDDSMILLREAVAFLSLYPDVELAESVYKTGNALAQAELHAPDVLLLDITTSGMRGLNLVQDLHLRCPGLPVIVLDEIETETIKHAAIAHGAASFIPKPKVESDLFAAILHGVSARGADQNALPA